MHSRCSRTMCNAALPVWCNGENTRVGQSSLPAGRFEFFQYFPGTTQGIALAPLSGRGCLVVAVNSVRGFSRLDQVTTKP